jgi:serine/threonine protein kinase
MYPPRYWQKFVDQWFGSKYLLKEFLGCGAFGAVFRADEMLADRVMQSVAIKIVIADMDRLDEQLAELKLAVRLRHPNLINGITCEQGDLGGDLCLGLVMELADHSLESYVQTHPQGLSVETVKTIATHLVQGLAAIHKEGIVHRDLKPANVLLVGDLWKLADFGIARSLQGKTSTQTNASQQIGSMAYMPPEAYSGKISPAWDLWSLGVMIHQLATGRHPFPTQLAPELMQMVLAEEPQIDATLASPLTEIVAGCLLKDLKRRWSVKRVLAELNPMIKEEKKRTPKYLFVVGLLVFSFLVLGHMSKKNASFRQLEKSLRNGDFKNADIITDSIINWELATNKNSYIDCRVISNINDLWAEYSEGRFGYNQQLNIWKKAQNDAKNKSTVSSYTEFQNEVGWIVNGLQLYSTDLEYVISAPVGHLPWSSWQVKKTTRYGFGEFMEKVQNCNSQDNLTSFP